MENPCKYNINCLEPCEAMPDNKESFYPAQQLSNNLIMGNLADMIMAKIKVTVVGTVMEKG